MQAGKNAMEAVRETAANIGASAKAGMDKTKATLEEKVEKMTAQHPAEKEMAEQMKLEKFREAETMKRNAMEHNAAVKEHAHSTYYDQSQGPPGVQEGRPVGGYVEDDEVAVSRPVGVAIGTARPSAAHNPKAGGTGHQYT
ncbi:hypothetical protein LUZ60_008651 [Juncus effusus]|nr:hypothetical protein LUZ60_008651 [Juncus effusus]